MELNSHQGRKDDTSISRYLIAIWTVGIAFGITLLFSRYIEPGISPLFLLAVMISSWRGGLGAGLLATILSAMASAFVFLPPRFSLQIDQSDMLQLVVFAVAAVLIGTLSAARKQADAVREELLVKEQAARREAEQANSVKDEFLAAISHELRTPLTTIKTLTRVMQRRETSEAERAEYLSDIASECDREIDLVLNLLDVSRINAAGVQIELSRVDAAEVVASCRKIVRGEAERRAQTFKMEIEPDLPKVRSDQSALRRALCAIVENAIKFTPEGGTITFRLGHVEDLVHVAIEDTGRGIETEDLSAIFDKFYRGRNAAIGAEGGDEVPGIGLGLNLAQTLVHGMNGKIDVISRPGEGSTFTVQLPVWNGDMDAKDEALAATTEHGLNGKDPAVRPAKEVR